MCSWDSDLGVWLQTHSISFHLSPSCLPLEGWSSGFLGVKNAGISVLEAFGFPCVHGLPTGQADCGVLPPKRTVEMFLFLFWDQAHSHFRAFYFKKIFKCNYFDCAKSLML